MSVRIVFILLLLSVTGFARPASGGPKSESSLEEFLRRCAYLPVPFQPDDDEPFLLKATIGEKKVKLEVDTGCSFTTIDPWSAPGAKTLGELHIELHDSLLGEIAEPSVVLIADLAFGPAHFFNQPARAEKLTADYVALSFDGLLGIDFLARNFCIIDCAGRQIYFRGARPTRKQEAAIERSLRGSGYTPIPIHAGKRMIIKGEIRGHPTDWIVDTGARYSFLEESELSRLKVKREQRSETGTNIPADLEGRLIGLQRIGLGTHRLTVARLSDLTVGERSWGNVYVGIVDMKMSELKGTEPISPNVHGFFGADFLLAHGGLIDFSTWILWFPPEPRG